ncbi:MAG: GTP 3',8-cyclase MoaA [Candidatus Thorarchaeota archaeon]|jgi:cyclic pyranopterin phosphate synthase
MLESDKDSLRKREPTCTHEPLVDAFGRHINYLRISLTQKCNHACFFCHSEGQSLEGPEMSPEEIERLVQMGVTHGVTRVKLTGGEPLLRLDIIDIIMRISPLVEDLSLTTNGTLLEDMASDLKDAGLDRVNVSLHTLRMPTYQRMTGFNNLSKVKRGIKSAIDAGLSPVKINMTIIKSINDDEIHSMMRFAAETGAILQLIELQDIPTQPDIELDDQRTRIDGLEEQFQQVATRIEQRTLHGRRRYTIPIEVGSVEVEVVRPMGNSSFCKSCTRLRVTSDGKLKPCLYREDNLVQVRQFLSDCKYDNQLLDAYIKAASLRQPFWQEEGSK